MQNRYEEVRYYSTAEIEGAVARNDPHELRVVLVGAALHHEDSRLVEDLCHRFSSSEHEELRGNAILGFGYLAVRFQQLNESAVRPLIEAALADSSDYVRGHAYAAAEDIAHYQGWQIAGYDP